MKKSNEYKRIQKKKQNARKATQVKKLRRNKINLNEITLENNHG